jgi:hypothetical protein
MNSQQSRHRQLDLDLSGPSTEPLWQLELVAMNCVQPTIVPQRIVVVARKYEVLTQVLAQHSVALTRDRTEESRLAPTSRPDIRVFGGSPQGPRSDERMNSSKPFIGLVRNDFGTNKLRKCTQVNRRAS